jgi:dihydropteroate synthase
VASRPAGALRLGRRVFEPSELLVMAVVSAAEPAAAMERVHAVVAEGADAVQIGPVLAGVDVDLREEIRRIVPFVATVRDAYPELVVGVSTGRREVAREACAAGAGLLDGSGVWLAEVAASFGAGVVCAPGLAARAVEVGVEPERIIVGSASVRDLADVVATGWPVLVSPPDHDPAGSLAGSPVTSLAGSPVTSLAASLATSLATAAVGAWLGARVFRVDRVRETRRALQMVLVIRGDIPPACAVRGLA